MPTKSTNKKPQFKSEAEEADWYHTPQGRRHASRILQNGRRKGTVVVNDKVSIREAMGLARGGKLVVLKKGAKVKQTNPAVLQDLMDRVKAKRTQAVSLRLPVADIDAAKKIASQTGLGYQTVLKEIISKGLR
jgi:predicted DNA binding CopG/RHH family protein